MQLPQITPGVCLTAIIIGLRIMLIKSGVHRELLGTALESQIMDGSKLHARLADGAVLIMLHRHAQNNADHICGARAIFARLSSRGM